MGVRIAVSTWSFHPELLSGKLTIEALLEFCRENHIDGLEVVDIDLIDISLEKLRDIKRQADAMGIEISCLSLEHDLSRYSAEARQDDVNKVLRWMSYAQALGVKLVRVFTGRDKVGVPYDQQAQWVYDGLTQLAAKAEELQIDLVLENHNNICKSADEILDVIEKIGSPRLFTCPDPYNYIWSNQEKRAIYKESIYDDIGKILPYAKNYHMKVTKVDDSGEDIYMDCGRWLNQMQEYGYEGYWTIEFSWPNREPEVDFLDEVGKAAKLLKKHLVLLGE